MKSILNQLIYPLFFIGLSSIIGCSEIEVARREYPFLVTKTDNLSNSGITLIGEILSGEDLSDLNIGNAGFMLSSSMDNSISPLKIIVSEYSDVKSFKLNLRTDLNKDQTYSVRAFLELSNGQLVLGPEVSFLSKGSIPPPLEIEDITPTNGTDFSNITLSGLNFGYNPNLIQILIDGKLLLIDSINSRHVYGKIPPNIPVGSHEIVIKSYGREKKLKNKFDIESPQISTVSPNKAFDLSIVEIHGKFFGLHNKGSNYFSSSNSSLVLINGMSCEILDHSDTTIIIRTPETSFYGTTKLYVQIGGKKSNEQEFIIQAHEINLISPLTCKVGSTIEVVGMKFLINRNRRYSPVVEVNGIIAPVFNIADTALKFLAPLTSGQSKVVIRVGQKSIEYENEISIDDSWSDFSRASNLDIPNPLMCQISNVVFFGLGNERFNYQFVPDFWMFDTNSHKWTQLQSFPDIDLSKAYFRPKRLVIHNENLHFLFRQLETDYMYHFIYEIHSDRWIKLNDTNVRTFEWIASINGKMYGNTFYSENGTNPKMYLYNDESDTWEYLYDTKWPTKFHFTINEKLLVNDGNNNFYQLDIQTGTYTKRSDFPATAGRPPYYIPKMQTLIKDNNGYVIINNPNTNENEFWQYNLDADVWIKHKSFVDNREYALFYQVNGNIFFGLGSESNDLKYDIWRY